MRRGGGRRGGGARGGGGPRRRGAPRIVARRGHASHGGHCGAQGRDGRWQAPRGDGIPGHVAAPDGARNAGSRPRGDCAYLRRRRRLLRKSALDWARYTRLFRPPRTLDRALPRATSARRLRRHAAAAFWSRWDCIQRMAFHTDCGPLRRWRRFSRLRLRRRKRRGQRRRRGHGHPRDDGWAEANPTHARSPRPAKRPSRLGLSGEALVINASGKVGQVVVVVVVHLRLWDLCDADLLWRRLWRGNGFGKCRVLEIQRRQVTARERGVKLFWVGHTDGNEQVLGSFGLGSLAIRAHGVDGGEEGRVGLFDVAAGEVEDGHCGEGARASRRVVGDSRGVHGREEARRRRDGRLEGAVLTEEVKSGFEDVWCRDIPKRRVCVVHGLFQHLHPRGKRTLGHEL
mmetsp:Transcript_24474/g.83669  ORF Transcript_24474/g.83669 Transcript_24474/m.83669 type:complete len:400 (+) Transcript_24474:1-1200(+)